MSAFGLQNQPIVATPAGRIDSRFLNGADGSNLFPTWSGAPTLNNLNVGTSLSIDLATFLNDPGSPTSQLGFYVVSGTDPLTAGFSFSGTLLLNSNLRAVSGVFRLVAVRGEVSALSDPISYVIAAPIAGTDNVAPTVPTGITTAPGTAVGTVTLTFDAPTDIAPPNAPASGLVHVDVLVNGAVASPPSPIVTPTNALVSPVDTNIGAIASPDVPVSSQNAKAWLLTAAGTGIASTTAEQCLLTDFGLFSGAQRIVAELNPYTSSSATALMGVMLHETAVSGGKFLAIGLRPSNGTVGLFVESRATASASSTQVATQLKDANGQSIVGPVYVKIERAADAKTLTVSYSLNGLGWTLITTQTLAMNAAIHYGLFITSQSSGTDVSGTVSEVSINNSGVVTATVPATTPSQIQLRATDADGNVSALSASILGVPKTAATGAQIKFHVGLIMGSNNINGGSDSNANEFSVCAAAGAKCIGWYGIYTWRQFETSDGVYDFSMLVNHFNALQAKKPGARFGAQIWCEAFSGTTVSFGIPQFILNSSTYGPVGPDGIHFGYWPLDFGSGNQGGTAALWRTAVNERYTRVFEHLATTSFLTTAGPYAGQTFTFDTHPLIEAFFDQESSLSLASGSDYSENTFTTLSVARYVRSAAAFPHTNFAPLINFLNGSPPDVALLVTGAFNARCAMSWPDTTGAFPTHSTWAQHFYAGDAYNGTTFVPGGTDLRGKMACIAWVEQPDYPTYTAADMFNTMQNLRVNQGVFTYVTGGNGDWNTKVLPLINSSALTATACPAAYNGACFSG